MGAQPACLRAADALKYLVFEIWDGETQAPRGWGSGVRGAAARWGMFLGPQVEDREPAWWEGDGSSPACQWAPMLPGCGCLSPPGAASPPSGRCWRAQGEAPASLRSAPRLPQPGTCSACPLPSFLGENAPSR